MSDTHATSRLRDFRSDSRMLILSALAVPAGIVSALMAKFLLWLIAVITNFVFFQRYSPILGSLQNHHLGPWVILAPVAGSLVVGLMSRFGSEKIRGHGIPEAIEAILLGKSLIDPKVALLKPVSSAISIGTGGPFGAEGPIIMTGGACGSMLAQLFHLTAVERKTLLVAGAAAGMSAVFASPVAAILLAVELLLFEWRPRSFVPVAVASIVAAVARVPLLGGGPVFGIPLHAAPGAAVVGLAILIGAAGGAISCALTSLVYACEDAFARLPIHWKWWPAIGGLFVGLIGFFDPRVLGVGYESIHALLLGDMLGKAVVILLIAKAAVWAVALGSGTSGGVLAPLLIIGASLGALLAGWLPVGDPGLWAMAGMAALMGGSMRAPFTGAIFIMEMTHDLNALPVLVCASFASLVVTVLALPRSILTEKLARRGQHIACEFGVDPFDLVRVGEVMDRELPTAPAIMPLRELAREIARESSPLFKRHGTLLLDEAGQLAGVITRGDLLRAMALDPGGSAAAGTISRPEVISAYPDETLAEALAKMLKHDIGRLPVVSRHNPHVAIGYLGRSSILTARHRHHQEEVVRERGFLFRPMRARL